MSVQIQLAIYHRIIRLIAHFPLRRVFPADNGLRPVIALLILSKFKPFMLSDSCPGRLPVRIVHRCIPLEIGFIQHFRLKADTPVFQKSQVIVEIGINRPCIDDLICQTIQLSL